MLLANDRFGSTRDNPDRSAIGQGHLRQPSSSCPASAISWPWESRCSCRAVTIRDGKLRGRVAFGPERTVEQDSPFALRIVVDIAIKALSKAINDPTTAVVAIDQLHRLLRAAGKRHLHDDTVSTATVGSR